MLAGVWLAYFSFGVVQGGIPPLIGPVSEDLGLNRSTMGTVLGAWPLIYILTAIPAGALLDRFSLKFTIMAGILFIGLSGLLRAVAVDYKTILFAVFGGPERPRHWILPKKIVLNKRFKKKSLSKFPQNFLDFFPSPSTL